MAEHSEYLLGILASGNGSNLEAIDETIQSGELDTCRIAAVISNKETAGALSIAQDRAIPAFSFPQTEQRDQAITNTLIKHDVDLVVAAGYLPIIGKVILDAYPDKVIGIHPGPLPDFGGKGMHGRHVHEAVIRASRRWSGPTAYLLDEGTDTGQILGHLQVPVFEEDTPIELGGRVLQAEHLLLPQIIKQLRDRDRPK